jgi:hypothetical protein
MLPGKLTTTVVRLARTDDKAASSLPFDLAGKILTVVEVGIANLLEVVDN